MLVKSVYVLGRFAIVQESYNRDENYFKNGKRDLTLVQQMFVTVKSVQKDV